MKDFKEFVVVVGGMVLLCCVFVVGLISISSYFENKGCDRVCTANGDENAYHWTTSCYCKDSKGFYNPKDSRDSR